MLTGILHSYKIITLLMKLIWGLPPTSYGQDLEFVWDAGTIAMQCICSEEKKNYIYKVKHTME